MPPGLAATACIIFILFLLRMEKKQNPSASPGLWIPTIWLLMVSIKPLGVLFAADATTTMEEGSILDRLVLSGLLIIGLAILINRRFSWLDSIKKNKILFILMGFMFLSVFWSDMPYVSFKRLIRGGIIAIIMALIVASESYPRQAILSVFRRVIYIEMPLSILWIKYYNALGVTWGRWNGEVMWIGVSQQKNGLALLCLFSIFFLLWQLIAKWKGAIKSATWYEPYIEIFLLALSFWMFMGPKHSPLYSATSTATLVIGITSFFALYRMDKKGMNIRTSLLTIGLAAAILYGVVTSFAGGFTIVDPSGLLERTENLTGRSEIWQKLIPLAMQNPVLGHGFGGFWTDEFRELVKTSDAHNGYLDVILNTGFMGLVLTSVFLISSSRKAQHEMSQNFLWGAFWFCMILMIVTHNIAESSIDAFTGLTPLIIFIHISSQYREPVVVLTET